MNNDDVLIMTGSLGQGLVSAVYMAMAARRERGLYDPNAADGESPFDHNIWVIASDGDLQEGVTSEASSLDRKSTRLNSSHVAISYAVFCLKKKKIPDESNDPKM